MTSKNFTKTYKKIGFSAKEIKKPTSAEENYCEALDLGECIVIKRLQAEHDVYFQKTEKIIARLQDELDQAYMQLSRANDEITRLEKSLS